VRVVPIPNVISPFFEGFSGRVLSTVKGGLMTETAFTECWDSFVRHLSKNAGHPISIRPHDLRHTYCTLLADAGVSIKPAMQWMGHSDEKMILHVYDHISDQRTQNSIDQVDSMLLKGQKEGQP
jgi:integrase